jgi:hypothetical protein
VRVLLGSPAARVTDWTATLLSRQGRRGVYRIAGSALDGTGLRTWRLVLKVIQPPPDALADPPASWAYWEREARIYQAGIVADLPGGLRAARCYGVTQQPGGAYWIWLEALAGMDTPWSLARYGLVATHLGQFNGAYLAGRTAPAAPWLSQDWLRDRTADLPQRLARVTSPTTWAHPLVRRAFPVPVAARCQAIAARRATWLAQLARLPQTFCHLDAWRGNLGTAGRADGQPETIVLDWAFAGAAPPGQEISPLIWVALLEFLVEAHTAAALEETILESYLAGLHTAGWRGDPRAVRFAYLASALLQWATVPEALLYACDADEGAWAERHWGRPRAEIVEASAAVTYALLEREAEAVALSATLP